MNELSFDEVVEAAQHLRPEEIEALFRRIQSPRAEGMAFAVPTAEPDDDDLRAVNESLSAAGAFEGDERLFVPPASPTHHITAEELLAAIEDISSEWDPEAGQLL
jgi:hypothetical protein